MIPCVKILQKKSATRKRARATKLNGPFQGPSSSNLLCRWSLIKPSGPAETGRPRIRKCSGGATVGLFGGTFDPIHFGHLRAAEEVREGLGLSSVIFIPAALPPHKARGAVASSGHRLAMVRLAVEPNAYFNVSDAEVRRTGKSYSIETIRSFQQTSGPETSLYFVMGMDAFLEIATWKSVDRLFSLCHFVVMTRPGYVLRTLEEIVPLEIARQFCYDHNSECWNHESGYSIIPFEITHLDISATRIRDNIKMGRSMRFLVPEKVSDYIEKHGFYRTGT